MIPKRIKLALLVVMLVSIMYWRIPMVCVGCDQMTGVRALFFRCIAGTGVDADGQESTSCKVHQESSAFFDEFTVHTYSYCRAYCRRMEVQLQHSSTSK